MAVAPYTTGSAPRVCPLPSVATKIYCGLKLQSARPFGAATPNVNAAFYAKVNKVLQFRYANQKPVRAQIQMIPIGTPVSATVQLDLEFDYINPYDSSSRINKVVLPEYITLGVLCCFYLVTGHWIMSLFCAPYLYYNVRLYRQGKHLVDVTKIFNMLPREKKQRLFKLFYLIFILFLSLFWLIYTSLDDDYD